MKKRKNTSIVTAWNRAQLGVLALALAMTSAQVEVPGASAFTAPVDNPEVVAQEVTPAGDLQALETYSAELPIAKDVPKPVKKTVKKKWNTISAPDLETQPDYSAEAQVRTMVVPTTAYTSDVAETDSSPFTTADGSQVRDGIIAANFLPHGTRVRIPDYFGNKVFEVHDRMNKRYQTRVDIWMLNKSDAYAWGVRNVKIEILP